jgi:hypothetical protein
MTGKTAFASFGVLIFLAAANALGSDSSPDAPRPLGWQSFWSSVGVNPPPPRNFLDVKYTGRIDNLTDGKLSDATVRRWVLADLRRAKGDLHAGFQLRDDMANANVFGPPGLNGTGAGIQAARAKGVHHIEGATLVNVVAAAVIAVPKKTQAESPRSAFTDFVIVLMYRQSPNATTLVYRDGRREEIGRKNDGTLYWQLDTGRFYEHPVLGPLWYQENGWSCVPDDSAVGKLCGLVRP